MAPAWIARRLLVSVMAAVAAGCASAPGGRAVASAEPSVPAAGPSNHSLSITNGFAGFVDRCSRRGVTCLADAAIDDRPSERVSTLIARKANVARRCTGSECRLYMRANGTGWCEPMYFFDGNAVDRAFPENALSDIERALTPKSIRGIEIYSSEQAKPAEIAVPENCGAILIWGR